MAKNDEKIIYAWLATFLTIIGFIIAITSKKEDKYVMFYAKQGLVVFIASIIVSILFWIPIISRFLWIFVLVLWLMTWINALSGEERNTWLIQDLAKKIKI